MSAERIGLLSGVLVLLSIFPYAVRTYQRKIRPVPTSWALWTLIGLAVLLTYRSSGAGANLWPAVFGFTNPAVIAIFSLWRRDQWSRLSLTERLCLAIGLVSLVMWILLRRDRELSQYALFVAMVADLCAAIPTVRFVWAEPEGDRPFAWLLFAVGYFLAVFAAPVNNAANLLLPLYMAAVALCVALPLILHRVRCNAPLKEWI